MLGVLSVLVIFLRNLARDIDRFLASSLAASGFQQARRLGERERILANLACGVAFLCVRAREGCRRAYPIQVHTTRRSLVSPARFHFHIASASLI